MLACVWENLSVTSAYDGSLATWIPDLRRQVDVALARWQAASQMDLIDLSKKENSQDSVGQGIKRSPGI